jgi:uncharacterized repeat protein (TIGR02543 family)
MTTKSPAVLLALLFSAASSRAASYTLTVVTNPPQGGTITGGGTYQSGATANATIQAANGQYISSVLIDGSTPLGFETAEFAVRVEGNGDLTTITNDTESETMNGNHTLSASFAPLSPTITQSPVGTTLITSNQVDLVGSAYGRQPILYQWRKDGVLLTNQTNGTLFIESAQPVDSGVYTLVASNAFGTNITAPAIVGVYDLLAFENGVGVTNDTIDAAGSVSIGLESRFPDALIFYTTDGSDPDFNGFQYFGTFFLTQSCTLRAIAYSDDFFETDLTDPIAVSIVPNYVLSVTAPDCDTILANGQAVYGPQTFGSNATVTLTANPASGFVFTGWSGDLSGTNPVAVVTVDSNVAVQAGFATTLTTTAAGGGTVSVFPAASLYPCDSLAVISAVPTSGNYFGIWGNAASGVRANPLYFSVYTGTPEVSALFAPLPEGQAAITVLANGGGRAYVSPETNKCRIGTTLTLTAIPDPGEQFLGWTGDATGTTNLLSVVMNASKVITAQFSRAPTLAISVNGGKVELQVTGVAGDSYQIQASDDLVHWLPLTNLVNYFGIVSWSAPCTPIGCTLYRAAVIPGQ